MPNLHSANLHEDDFNSVNTSDDPPLDSPPLQVGDRARHLLGGPEMIIVQRYIGGKIVQSERAVARWLNGDGKLEEAEFFAGNLRRVVLP